MFFTFSLDRSPAQGLSSLGLSGKANAKTSRKQAKRVAALDLLSPHLPFHVLIALGRTVTHESQPPSSEIFKRDDRSGRCARHWTDSHHHRIARLKMLQGLLKLADKKKDSKHHRPPTITATDTEPPSPTAKKSNTVPGADATLASFHRLGYVQPALSSTVGEARSDDKDREAKKLRKIIKKGTEERGESSSLAFEEEGPKEKDSEAGFDEEAADEEG
ncbi:hypothetical protein FRC01_012650, partial [Tulasnella sp. 417]